MWHFTSTGAGTSCQTLSDRAELMEAYNMSDAVDLWEQPEAEEIYLIGGWRQWADAGSISSGLPRYLARKSRARQIGTLRPDGFYLFQFPGTHRSSPQAD